MLRTRRSILPFNVDVVVDSYTDDSSEVKEKKIQLRFINSMRFVASSFGSLKNNLVKDGRKLNGFEDYSEEQYELLIRKGVYPSEYISSWLTPKEAFYSNLNMSDISDQDYSHTQKIWKGFGIRNMEDITISNQRLS